MLFLLGVPGKLKTLVTRLSATWAAKLDTLAADYTTARAAKLDFLTAAVTTAAVWTGTKAGYLDAAVSSRLSTAINSLQTGYVSTATSAGAGEDAKYVDVVVTAVVIAKSIVLSQSDPNSAPIVTSRLTTTTNLRLTAPAAAGTLTGRWYIIELK